MTSHILEACWRKKACMGFRLNGLQPPKTMWKLEQRQQDIALVIFESEAWSQSLQKKGYVGAQVTNGNTSPRVMRNTAIYGLIPTPFYSSTGLDSLLPFNTAIIGKQCPLVLLWQSCYLYCSDGCYVQWDTQNYVHYFKLQKERIHLVKRFIWHYFESRYFIGSKVQLGNAQNRKMTKT